MRKSRGDVRREATGQREGDGEVFGACQVEGDGMVDRERGPEPWVPDSNRVPVLANVANTDDVAVAARGIDEKATLGVALGSVSEEI